MKASMPLVLGLTIFLAVGTAAVGVDTDPPEGRCGDSSSSRCEEDAKEDQAASDPSEVEQVGEAKKGESETQTVTATPIRPAKIATFVNKGVEWLIASQHEGGGWGAGSHARQQIRDPHKVQTDPATTAFTLLSLLRAGHSPVDGEHKEQVIKGLRYLLRAVEDADDDGPRITKLEGTQPQTKLGPFVDTALTAQYLGRVVKLISKNDTIHARVDKALDKCLAKLQKTQQQDGSWGKSGGWAPVLQSSLSCSALEIAQANGKKIDSDKLQKARDYLSSNVDTSSGRAKSDAAAGVELYAFGGGQRANAPVAAQAERALEQAKREGKLEEDAEATTDNLRTAGFDAKDATKLARAAAQNQAQLRRFDNEQLLKGFGNNGGEEYLSYLMTSESLVIAGADKFHKWNDKVHGRLQKVQNPDGSWSGHHCITSPVFCTAAVVQCLTTDRDAEFLIAMSKKQQDVAKVAQKD